MRIDRARKSIDVSALATGLRYAGAVVVSFCAVALYPAQVSAEIIRPQSTFQRIYAQGQAETSNFARIEDRTAAQRFTRIEDQSAAKRFTRKVNSSWKGWSDPTADLGWAGRNYHRTYRSTAPGEALTRKKARFEGVVSEVAAYYNLPESLLHAVITAESAYNPNAVSSAGARGLMQLMPATARRFGVTNAYNPGQNIRGGARYLKELMGMFNSDLNLVLAAYNAGEGAVLKHGRRIPPYDETRRYVRKVRAYYEQYSGES